MLWAPRLLRQNQRSNRKQTSFGNENTFIIFQINERLGSLFTAIGNIRAEVDTMYTVRERFVNTWKKLTNELEDIAQKKNKVTDESLIVLDERYVKYTCTTKIEGKKYWKRFESHQRRMLKMENYLIQKWKSVKDLINTWTIWIVSRKLSPGVVINIQLYHLKVKFGYLLQFKRLT